MQENRVYMVRRLRTPAEVIDAAVKESRFGERVLYGLSALFALVGVGLAPDFETNG
jgi:hypothetical protein